MNSIKLLQKQAERRYTLGVVYEPDVTDTQGEFAKAEDIEVAAWEFLANLQREADKGQELAAMFEKAAEDGAVLTVSVEKSERDGLDDQHHQVDEDLGVIVESYLAPTDLTIQGQTVKKGAWLLGVVWSEAMFEKIKNGERTGLSMYGHAMRVED